MKAGIQAMDGYFIFIVSGPDAQGLRTGLTRDPQLRSARGADTERLLYFELCQDEEAACRRERQLRRWSHARRASLISAMNPLWCDLRSLW